MRFRKMLSQPNTSLKLFRALTASETFSMGSQEMLSQRFAALKLLGAQTTCEYFTLCSGKVGQTGFMRNLVSLELAFVFILLSTFFTGKHYCSCTFLNLYHFQIELFILHILPIFHLLLIMLLFSIMVLLLLLLCFSFLFFRFIFRPTLLLSLLLLDPLAPGPHLTLPKGEAEHLGHLLHLLHLLPALADHLACGQQLQEVGEGGGLCRHREGEGGGGEQGGEDVPEVGGVEGEAEGAGDDGEAAVLREQGQVAVLVPVALQEGDHGRLVFLQGHLESVRHGGQGETDTVLRLLPFYRLNMCLVLRNFSVVASSCKQTQAKPGAALQSL